MADAAKGALTPIFSLKVDGTDVPVAARGDVLSIEVDDCLDAPAAFAVELANWDQDKQQVTWSDDNLFRPGAKVQIELGFDDRKASVMDGEVTGLELLFGRRSRSVLIVLGHDRLHRLRRGRRTKTYEQVKDSDLAAEFAKAISVDADVEDSAEVHEQLLQRDQTDLDFLLERARAIGYELLLDDKLRFRKVKNALGKVQTFGPASGMISACAYLSTAGQVSEVSVLGWDPKTKKALVGKAGAGDVNGSMGGSKSGPDEVGSLFGKPKLTVIEHPVATQNEADLLARGFLNEIALQYVVADVELIGEPQLKAGEVIELEGLGKRFSGSYYLRRVRHRLGAQGFATTLEARRNST